MKIEKLSVKSFKSFGKIIEYPNREVKGKTRNLWRVLHTESQRVGWRVAYLVLRDKSIGRMECHRASDETFEPVKGQALFFVSHEKDLNNIRCFLLDRPIILNKGTWHGLISVSEETEIKITENAKVSCKYWNFGFRIKSFEDLQQRLKKEKAVV